MTIIARRTVLPPIQTGKWVRNGFLPAAQFGARVLDDLVAVQANMRRCVATFYTSLSSIVAYPAGTEEDVWRIKFRSGEGVGMQIVFVMTLGPNATSLSDPYCKWTLTEVGVGSTDSKSVHFNWPSTSVYADGPFGFGNATVRMDISPNTEYEAVLKRFGANPIGCCVYEEHARQFDETGGNAAEPGQVVAGQPIDTAQITDLLQDGHKLWRHNAATLFTWASGSNSNTYKPTRTSATAANAFDTSKTSFATGDPAFKVQPLYRNPYHSANVACVFAAHGRMATGTADGTVTLRDSSGTIATLSGFAQGGLGGGEWKSTTCNLDGTSNLQELQVYIAGDGTDTFVLEACTLYMYVT